MPNSYTLTYYLQRVQRESGLTVSSSFPSGTVNDEDQLAIDCINTTLRELNNHYYLAFKQTEYIFTPTAGVSTYDLRNSPYSQTFFRVNRIARNGISRYSDNLPLEYIDYSELDWLQPKLTGNTDPGFYSAYGENLILFPAPAGNELLVRYYGRHIGTGNTGIRKLRLSVATDVTMLEDDWEDALVYGAAFKVRAQQVMDEKTAYYKARWEEWRQALIDMSQPGEEAFPQAMIIDHSYSDIGRKVGSFFNSNR